MHESEADKSDNSTRTMLAQSPANLMISDLLGPEPDLKQIIGSTTMESHEPQSPKRPGTADSILAEASFSDYCFDDNDSEACLNIHDFLDFGETSESDLDLSQGSSLAVSKKRYILLRGVEIRRCSSG